MHPVIDLAIDLRVFQESIFACIKSSTHPPICLYISWLIDPSLSLSLPLPLSFSFLAFSSCLFVYMWIYTLVCICTHVGSCLPIHPSVSATIYKLFFYFASIYLHGEIVWAGSFLCSHVAPTAVSCNATAVLHPSVLIWSSRLQGIGGITKARLTCNLIGRKI